MVEHQMIYSPEENNNNCHNETLWVTSLNHLVNNDNNLLTLLAAGPPSSHPEWILLCLLSCFPHVYWVLSNSFSQSGASLALHPLSSVD
jgi:hypothetical protein